MKILFINPPHIRSGNSSPQNNFKVDGFVFRPEYRKVPGAFRVFRFLNKKWGVGKGVRYGVRAGSRWPWTMPIPHGGPPYPFFMGYAAAYLLDHGFDVNILDAVAEEQYNYDGFLDEIRKEDADIVVLECSTPTIDIDMWFARRIAKFAEVALAGPHIASSAGEVAQNCAEASYFLKGEYTKSALQMAQTREPGIYETQIVADLDSIPFPFRDYKSATKYYDPTMPTQRPQLQIYGSRGCPFKCIFCAWPQTMYFGHVSLRKPENIAREITSTVQKYGYKSIFFDDDTFNVGTQRISRLCDRLRGIGIPWTMMGRLDCSPDWLFDKMVESGCVGMRFGVETFNLDVLKSVQKGIERTDFEKTLRRLSKKYPKLMIHLTMMKDMPGQSDKIHRADIEILSELGYRPSSSGDIYRNYQLSHCAPFPGTEMNRQLSQKLGVKSMKLYQDYDGGRETITTHFKVNK